MYRRVEVALCLDPRHLQCLVDLITISFRVVCDKQYEIIPACCPISWKFLDPTAEESAQSVSIDRDKLLARFHQFSHPSQGKQPNRRVKLAHSAGQTQMMHFFSLHRILSVIPHGSNSLRECSIIRRKQSSFNRCHDFCRAHRKDLTNAKPTQRLTVIGRAQPLSAVEIDGQSLA